MSTLKSWQVFVFALIPLVLIFGVVIIWSPFSGGSSGSGGSASPAAQSAAPSETPPAPSDTLDISAKDLKFNQRSLTALSGGQVTIHFTNQDKGVLHNVSVYTDKSAKTAIYTGKLISGVAAMDYTFPAPPPGSYFFRCDAHPDMNGPLTIQ